MCMLTVFPIPELVDNKTIDRLHNGASFNNDGHGWAVISEGRILTGKSMDASLAIDAFATAYAKATGPALFHSRWATHGVETLANVHPFPVRKMANTYLAHNGIMPKDAFPQAGDKRSDTRIFADEILPQRFPRLDQARTRARLSQYLGGNKIAILTTNRRFRRNLYIVGMELGNWVDGVWFSNYDHEGYHYRWGSGTVVGGKHEEAGDSGVYREYLECLWCHEKQINDWDVCENCGTCQDCLEPYRNCQCYVPRYQGGTVSTGGPAALESAESLSNLDR